MRKFLIRCACVMFCVMILNPSASHAQQELSAVEIDGDQMEYSVEDNKVVASGNVIVSKGDVRLKADRIEYFRDSQEAVAEGNVVLERGGQRLEGRNMTFNFKTMVGGFEEPEMVAPPLFGKGERIMRLDDEHFRIYDGYVTTSDFDDPETRVTARTIDVYPEDKAVARNVKFKIGKVPVFYLPRYTYDLKHRKPTIVLTPGYSGEWGGFVLGRYHYNTPENYELVFHADVRERKGFGWGVDDIYRTENFGRGILRTYYTHERDIGSNRLWDDYQTVVEKERYKADWRHRWNVDDETTVVAQYYKLSDSEFLKDYFESEYDQDSSPESYVVASRAMSYGTLAARADYRVNQFVSTVERLPEVKYSLPSAEILDSGFYFKNSSSYSNLVKQEANPSDNDRRTQRVDFSNELSRPWKIGFIETRPFVGTRQTYYSRAVNPDHYDTVRGVFETGMDASTKFYRTYDARTNILGLDINQLRHVITPSAAYLYRHDPTITATQLDQYDGVDALTHQDRVKLSLENKLQTKREDQSVDLVRTSVYTHYLFNEEGARNSKWDNWFMDVEVIPYSWLSFYVDGEYDVDLKDIQTANFEMYINDPGKLWYLRFADRYEKNLDNQIDTEVGVKLNPKWDFRVRQRYDIQSGQSKEQEYGFVRDLHTWLMHLTFNKRQFDGEEFWVMFSLKEFPDLRFSASRAWSGGAERPGYAK
ncbi:MAG TPA: LPS assembly protein LptD [Candidatus Omnitrophota bacterium]|nr:LPS assembly protein LptD [Candidatus Omnitrophota bacterium]